MSRSDLEPASSASGKLAPVRNVLFIMCDQLRWDALSCYGHALIDTPNLDALAARGVRYDQAFINGTTCGSSRMSYYTGQYVQTHGARYNGVPLRAGHRTLGDHLRNIDVESSIVGKTHAVADRATLRHLGIEPGDLGFVSQAQCGFEPVERDDGLHPDQLQPGELPYNRFLREHGFDGDNPWHTAANSVVDDDGNHVSGWLLRAGKWPAIVPDELSETSYMTDRAIDFIRQRGDERWCLHLSFIKPHWPYVVSAPYHDLVHPNDLAAPCRTAAELDTDHPVLQAFRQSRIGRTMSRDDVRCTVWPAYLGLVKQIDVHLGRLFAVLEQTGRSQDTMIAFVSDHGDYLGDHWQGEKDWFHDQVVRTPMLIVDPRADADATRGGSSTELVEAIDLVPTFIDALGGDLDRAAPWLEGRSLVPSLHGHSVGREAAVCESDFAFLEMANYLPATERVRERRATMLRTDRWKYVLSEIGPNLLYDLHDDPDDFVNRAGDPAVAAVEAELHDELFSWYRRRAHDTTYDDAMIAGFSSPGQTAARGFIIGYWDEAELDQGIAGDLP